MMKIKSPFGAPPAGARPVATRPRPGPAPAAPRQQQQTFAGAFANTIAPMLGKLPARMLPANYKDVAEAGLEMTKSAVEQSGVTRYLSFDPFKNYFNITHRYVLRKLLLVAAPYTDSVI